MMEEKPRTLEIDDSELHSPIEEYYKGLIQALKEIEIQIGEGLKQFEQEIKYNDGRSEKDNGNQ